MFNESKAFIRSKTGGSKIRAIEKALMAKKSSPKEMIKSAHKRVKSEGVDFNKI